MSDESRIRQLVEETLDSSRTPEEVCAEFPELLFQVRERLHRFRGVEAQLDAIFPPSNSGSAARHKRLLSAADALPQIHDYRIEAVLGRGGVGIVYKAMHLKLNRYVALKMLLSGAYANPHELARFTREAEAVASVSHPHIVQIHDIGELDGKPFFTMELVEGASLAQKLAGVPQPAAYAASLLTTLASAVHVAHQAGIVHRDLKPSNILLLPDGTPKITDFGLARRIEGESAITLDGAHVGTPSYMAPEQALGNMSAIGRATDVYGLGAILYEMLTGRPPFRGETASDTERQLISGDPVPPARLNRKVPRDLETICLKCLSKDPSRRYSSAAALADDLRRFQEGAPIQARPVSLAERVWRWSLRKPATAALLATAAALLAVAVGGGFWAQRQQADARALEARHAQAIEAALAHAQELRNLGHWPEARAALQWAPGVLDTSIAAPLRERLRQARADVEMVIRLEDVRLRLSEGTAVVGRSSPTADRLYSEAFEDYGISLKTSNLAATAKRIQDSAIHDTLVVFLHDWLYWVTQEHSESLRTLVEAADDDPWRREFREARAKNDTAKLEDLAHAPHVDAQPAAILSGLGGALLADGRREEAFALLRRAQKSHPGDFWINYLLGHLLERDRPQEAVGYFRAAVAVRPASDQAYALLGRALREAGDPDAAIAALNESIHLNPSRAGISELARALSANGKLEQARVLWGTMLKREPPDHESWYGYAQLCLFLGERDEYLHVREAMLRHFEKSNDWIVAERTSLATLLLPSSGDELRRVAALADRAVADASTSSEPDNRFVQFVKGLSEYRQGHDEQAAVWLGKAAANLTDRPGARLVLAMLQFRSASRQDARTTLARAVTSYNWRDANDDYPTTWVSHVLRREAEQMILPDLPAFLEGKYQPKDNDERLALQGICQSRHLDAAAARLYADAFQGDPGLADSLTTECLHRASRENDAHGRVELLKTDARYLAARCAASAGCGRGNDGLTLSDAERMRWRRQSRQWLLADLAAWTQALDNGFDTAPDLAKKMLTLWQLDPDLAGLREPDALNHLPADERAEWLALWKQTADVITRAQRTDAAKGVGASGG